jgi:prepilin-type processing-associated H-X9-DG protein
MRNLVNVAVVCLILLVSAALALSALGRMQQAAAQITCSDNLKLLARDLHHYHDQQQHFPAGTISNENLACDKRLSWYVDAWAYVGDGQQKLLIDKKKAWDAEENRVPKAYYGLAVPPHEAPVGDFRSWLCPRNPSRGKPGWPGVTHYVGVAGVGENAASLPAYAPQAGIFGYDRSTRLADIHDGTSNTLLLMETAWENGPWTAGGQPTMRGLDPKRQPYLGGGRLFGGTHSAGAGAAFADGSVRFLPDSMRPEVLEDLATIAGGTDISARW